MKLGYARVSTLGQSLEVQREKLGAFGCDRIYEEKKSGKTREGREELNKLLDEGLRSGDSLVCTKLDRLARSVLDLCQIAKAVENIGASLVVLDDNIDTSTPHGRLFFHILASVGEFERSLTLARTEEGRQKAKRKQAETGKRIFGPKDKLNSFQIEQLRKQFNDFKGPKRELAAAYQISLATLYRLAKAPAAEGGQS